MAEFMALKRVFLNPHHHQPPSVGATIHASGMVRPRAPFVELRIARYQGEEPCYLFHIAANGESTDTFHESLHDALKHAQNVYGVRPTEWLDVNAPF